MKNRQIALSPFANTGRYKIRRMVHPNFHRQIAPSNMGRSKYFLSVCTIIKDERNLEEFILYHWIHGVEHFYIYDNESAIPIKDRLNFYLFKKICTIIYFPGKPQQLNSYNHCLKNYGHETTWLYFTDGDEYILPKKHTSLRNFLIKNNDAHAIGINWVFFGTSFHEKKQSGFVIDNYRYTCNAQDQHIKTVCKPFFSIRFDTPHHVILKDASKYKDPLGNIISGPFNKIPGNSDIIQINHYYTRSIEESYEKQNRGRTDALLEYTIPHLHELNNDIKDDLISDKYLHIIQKLYEALHTNWEIYKALNNDLSLTLTHPDEYYKHLFYNGIKEGRLLKITDKYPTFSSEYYRNNYADLANFNIVELEKHYIYHGFNENRICDRSIL